MTRAVGSVRELIQASRLDLWVFWLWEWRASEFRCRLVCFRFPKLRRTTVTCGIFGFVAFSWQACGVLQTGGAEFRSDRSSSRATCGEI